ncbi:Vacuolar amino acid transporter 4 [Phytophthora cinnamomi]|uniref:Vacuolar amino acid transporter 4 n=1 Tax=Phytophthora cinnamomi TaxID=4785 RepID=UPI00355A480A|nr:Vacuolar amino acid transporter 4 [Phytophthora cinnamomi]
MASTSALITMDDAKTAFNLFCCVLGIGSLAMPSNYARAGPVYATVALGFMMFANTYAAMKLSMAMLAAPSSVKTYGDLGEWAFGKWGRFFTVVSQMGVCVLVPCAFLILGSTLLEVLFPDCFSQTFWIIFMALMVVPVCLIPTLKESAGMAFAGCMGTAIADIIAVSILQYNMRGHPSIPKPDVSMHQVLTCFGNLALAYGASIVIPDLQREHSQPQRMPRVVVVTMLIISAFFFAIALAGYTAGGCQISGNILYSIVDTSNPLGVAPLGFSANRGAVVMAYLFMQVHISIAFSTMMMPAFYMAERLVLGMHKTAPIIRFDAEQDQEIIDQDLELQDKQSYVQVTTPQDMPGRPSLLEKSDGRMSHLRAALEFNEEITEEQLREPYKGVKNTLRYIALRITIIVLMVIVAVAAQDKFLDLEDFTGSTAHTVNCMIMPVLIYTRVFWKKMSVLDKAASILVMVMCGLAGFYMMIHAGKQLFTPSEDDTAFPYCDAEYQDEPYYVRNSTN